MYRLVNSVRNYPWGSVTAIPELLGVPADGKPQAELWIGAHPAAPSLALGDDGQSRPLDDLIRADPVGLLGQDCAQRFGGRLPFLLKVLAAQNALSLQAHPDAGRAARRFTEEEDAGIPLDAPQRMYKDASAKPELIYALTPFNAVCGFRPPAATTETIRELIDRGASHSVLDDLLAVLSDADEGTALQEATRRLLTLPQAQVKPLVQAVAHACLDSPDPALATADRLARGYPEDAGVVVSLLLNTVRLDPGQAMFLPAGNVHAYLDGTGIEIMANSDNVLRGGLTDKHIDVAEFLDVVDFRALPVPMLTAMGSPSGERVFMPPAPEFALSVTRIDRDRPVVWNDMRPRAVLVLDGNVLLRGAGHDCPLARGESAFVPARDCPTMATGDGTMVAATTGGEV
jgi:mannose-6-phosphate isomerase